MNKSIIMAMMNQTSEIDSYINTVSQRLFTQGGYSVDTSNLLSFIQTYFDNGGVPLLLLNALNSNNPNITQTTTYNLGTTGATLDSSYVGTSADNVTMTEAVNDKVYKFNATNLQFIETINTRIIDRNLFTFSLWFKTDGTIVQRNLISVDTFRPRISWLSSQRAEAFWQPSAMIASSNLTFSANEWHFLTVTSDGTNAVLYKNGVALLTTTPTALIPPAVTSIPLLAVINPTESTFVTSS
jgi:hypothetical protein